MCRLASLHEWHEYVRQLEELERTILAVIRGQTE
jgi:hypothetical protein